MRLLSLRQAFQGQSFGRQVLTLMMGTGLAQALPIAAAPILSRLFSPADFGLFGLYMAVASVLAIVASGRYELAIVMTPDDDDALALVLLAGGLTLASSLFLLLVAHFFGEPIAQLLGNPAIRPWLYVVPLAVATTGLYQALNYWLNRQERYKTMAGNRVVRSTSTVGASIGIGAASALPGGLILGYLAGQVVGVANFLRTTYPDLTAGWDTGVKRLAAVARRYRRFPAYSVPADSINSLSGQLPVFILSVFFAPAVVGALYFSHRVLAAPISIVATAFGDVFKKRASDAYNEKGTCTAIWRQTFKHLVILALPPFLIVGLVAPPVFAFVFGEEWREAGVYAQLLTPFYFLSFVASPLSRTLYVTERQREDLFWQVGLFVLTGGALLTGAWLDSERLSIGLYAAAYSAMYLIYLGMSYRFARGTHG